MLEPAKNYNTCMNRAWVLFDLQRWEDAERELREAMVFNPGAGTPHAAIAWCLAKRDLKAALAETESALGLEPELAYAHYTRGHLLVDASRLEAALQSAQEALRLRPENPDYCALLARVWLAKRQWKKALQAPTAGLRFDARHEGCLALRAAAQQTSWQFSAAGQTARISLTINPENASAHEDLGLAALMKGRPKQAIEHFREAMRLNPQNTAVLVHWEEARKCLFLPYRLWRGYTRNDFETLLFAVVPLGIVCLLCGCAGVWAHLVNQARR